MPSEAPSRDRDPLVLAAKQAGRRGQLAGCHCYDSLSDDALEAAPLCPHAQIEARAARIRAIPSEDTPNRIQRRRTYDPRWTWEQQLAVLEAMELAMDPEGSQLYGCDCYRRGLIMPCYHCREAARDEAVHVMRRIEREKGSGWHVIEEAGRELESQADPQDKDGYRRSTEPVHPTQARPSSDEKKAVLTQRIEEGQSVYCPGDAFLRVLKIEPRQLRKERT